MNMAQSPVLILSVTMKGANVYEYGKLVEDKITNELSRVNGVATVGEFNSLDKQLLVDVNRQRLNAYGLSMLQVSGAIEGSNLTLPAGNLDIGRGQYTVRVPGEFDTIKDVENVIVGQSQKSGNLVYLKDIATVKLGMQDETAKATADQEKAMILMIMRESGANTVDVAQAVTSKIEQMNKTLPEGLHISVVTDLSDNITLMVDSLSEAMYFTGLIVILVVFFFLRRFRTSLIVAISIPLSIVGVFAMLAAGGYTLNMITIAAMAIAVGMVVDDSIVVLDNIIRHVELGKDPNTAAVEGAEEVSNAVTAATFATLSIFVPVMFVSGVIGIMFSELSYVIIAALGTSLLVSLMLVPVLGHRLLKSDQSSRKKYRLAELIEHWLVKLESGYGKIISVALRNQKKIVFVAIFAFAASLLLTKAVGVDFMPKSDGGSLQVKIELPIGTNVDYTYKIAQKIERIIRKNIPEATSTNIMAGVSDNPMMAIMGGRQGSNIATIYCSVGRRSLRTRSTFDMADAIRPEIKKIPELISYELDGANPLAKMATGAAKPIVIELYSDNIPELRKTAAKIKIIVKETPGSVDAITDMMDDNPEIAVNINRERAARLGVPIASIAASVRTSMYGNAVTRFRGGEDDIDVFLRIDADQRESVADLKSLTVPAMTGGQVRLSNIADISEDNSPIEIRHLDQQRMLRVMADVSGRALGDVSSDIEEAIKKERQTGGISSDVSTQFGGDVKEQRNMVVDLSIALLLSVLLIYMVMAAQFESLMDPLIVMFSVPFGITGVLLALPATGITLSITSFIGMIMLVGIVTKNAIVLVDYINQLRDKGMPLHEAIVTGGSRRLRPVLMTALTTIGGMLPLAISSGEGSEMWKPMAVAVIGGLALSTLVTLILIPSVYALTDRWRKRGREVIA